MDQFPSNSHAPRPADAETPEEKVVPKIVTGRVLRKKQPISARLREMFLADSEQSVLDYVVGDILVPALKDMMIDAVSEGFARKLNGGEGRSSHRRRSSSSSGGVFGNNPNVVAYNRYSERNERRPGRASRTINKFDDIVLSSRGEADNVVGAMIDCLNKYDVVSVADFYEMLGEPSHHTDNKWGWTNLDGAGVRRINTNSYMIVVPKPEPID